MVSGSDLDDKKDVKGGDDGRPTSAKSGAKPIKAPTKSTGLNKAAPAFFPSSMKQNGTTKTSKSKPKIVTNNKKRASPKASEQPTATPPTTTKSPREEKKSEEYDIIDRLIHHKLGEKLVKKGEIPRYILETFNAFCKEKKVITLNLFYLDRHFKEFEDLLMNRIEKDTHKTAGTPWQDNPFSKKNTLHGRLFGIFDNVNKLVINSTKYDGFPSYSFSLMSLLSAVELKASFKEIIIRATWDEANKSDGKRSWIYTMWHTTPLGAVKSLLKDSGCDIKFKKSTNSIGLLEDVLTIYRV